MDDALSSTSSTAGSSILFFMDAYNFAWTLYFTKKNWKCSRTIHYRCTDRGIINTYISAFCRTKNSVVGGLDEPLTCL